MPDPGLTSSLALVVANLVIAVGLVIQPGDHGRRHSLSPQRFIAVLCLLLSFLNILVALGPARYGLFTATAQVVSPLAFWISGACYAVSGFLLFRSPRARSRRHLR